MSNFKIAVVLFFVMLIPLSLLAEKIAVVDFKGIGVEASLVDAAITLLRSDISSYKNLEVIEKEQMEKMFGKVVKCENKETAAEIGFKLGAEKVVYGTISKLGEKYIISANVVKVTSHNIIFSDRVTATSAEDLDIASKRLAKSIATGEKVEKTAEIGKITEEETKEPRRRKSFYTVGGKFGMGMPFADSYGGAKMLMGGSALYWYETSKFIVEASCGGNGTPITLNIAETDTTVHAFEFTYAQLSLFYLFSKEDFCPYAGGGIGMRNLMIEKDFPGWSGGSIESSIGMALNLNAGLIGFRTYDFRILLDVQYSLNMANVGPEFGGPHHSIGISFGVTYRKQMGGEGCGGGGCGGCGGGGCL